MLDDPAIGALWLVLSPAGDAVGYLFLSYYFSLEYGGLTAFIDELYIDPAFRCRGLGTHAIVRVLEIAREQGLRAVHLEAERTNTRAAALYTRLGFVDNDRVLLSNVLSIPL